MKHDKYCEISLCGNEECQHDLNHCQCNCGLVKSIRTSTTDMIAERVREIHTKSPTTTSSSYYWQGHDLPEGEFYYCENCSDFEYTLEPYPCPTLRAVYGK